MAIPSRQIGWSAEDNLLWQISKQLEQLTNVTAQACTNCTTTTSTTTLPVYKVFTALLTQSGGDDSRSITDGITTIGVSYTIANYVAGDFTIIGAPNNLVGTSFIATGIFPDWGLSFGSQLVFNFGAPVATILENTIGNIWFTYTGVGTYGVESNGLFIIDKSLSIIGTPSEGVQNNNFAGVNFGGDSQFQINVVEPAGVNIDDLLDRTPIEIRVYN